LIARGTGSFALLPALIFGLMAGLMLAMPDVALEASLRGVAIWWDVLFPALFPFFVLSELMLGFGVVHLFGKLLDPLMRPLFRLSGLAGFVLAMGFVSGYPVGARMTSRLLEQRLIDRDQGERLVIMTTTADPLFLIGVVSVGFFGTAAVAPLLAAAHYGGAMLIGLLYRWRKEKTLAGTLDERPEGRLGPAEMAGRRYVRRKMTEGGRVQREAAEITDGNLDEPSEPAARKARGAADEPVRERIAAGPAARAGRLKQAVEAMHAARLADGRPTAVLLGDAVQSSLKLIIVVGGLVVVFSAFMELLLRSGLLLWLHDALGFILHGLGLPGGLSPALTQGTFEVTLGAKASAAPPDPFVLLRDRLAAAAFVLSWAGLSVHAQVAGLMSRTAWRYGPFARARLLHALVAAGLVYVLLPLQG
jgi:nucleoside recognition membrane protein YjiH